MEPKNLEPEQWKQDYREFIEATRRFYNKTLDTKTYKGISGGFGSYAQRGGNASMLRLRLQAAVWRRTSWHLWPDALKRTESILCILPPARPCSFTT